MKEDAGRRLSHAGSLACEARSGDHDFFDIEPVRDYAAHGRLYGPCNEELVVALHHAEPRDVVDHGRRSDSEADRLVASVLGEHVFAIDSFGLLGRRNLAYLFERVAEHSALVDRIDKG